MLNSTTNMLRYLKWHIDPLPSTWKSCFIADFSNNICFNQQLRNKNSRFTRFKDWYCWWFRNPVPVDVADIPASIGFHTSQVVSRISEPSVSTTFTWLVVSTHLKNISQMGNLPQIVVKIKKTYLKPPPGFFWGKPLLRHHHSILLNSNPLVWGCWRVSSPPGSWEGFQVSQPNLYISLHLLLLPGYIQSSTFSFWVKEVFC